MSNNPTLDTAQTLRAEGIAAIPVSETKQPTLGRWQQYQHSLPSPAALDMWFARGGNLALIAGDVQCIDFDTKYSPTAYDDFCALACECGLSDIVSRCILQKTPSGGRHLVFKSARNMGNLKLAKCENGNVAIETRGDGGYFLIAPSKGYQILRGSFAAIPEITQSERDALLEVARYFDARPKNREADARTQYPSAGDDYDAKADVPALLAAHGWQKVGAYGWRRPGKRDGISATWDKVPGRFYVFTTSTDFESEHVYRPWHVYAVLEHHGDFSAAAKALAAQGYGAPTIPTAQATTAQTFAERARKSPLAPSEPARPLPTPRLYSDAVRRPEAVIRPEEVVCGIVHRGCKLILSAPSKARKSWIMLDLGISVAAGARWLGYETVQTPVLHVDFELLEPFFLDRVSQIIEAKFGHHPDLPYYTLCLRGLRTSAGAIVETVKNFVRSNKVGLIIFDPVYRLATGLDENKAADVSELLFALEELAKESGAAIAFAHHYAKGNAGAKESIDRASGSGVWARDPDALMMLTPHEVDGAYVLESHLRNCPPQQSVVIQWSTPIFERNTLLSPDALKGTEKDKKKRTFTTMDLIAAMAVLKVENIDKTNCAKLAQIMGASQAQVIRLWTAVKKQTREN